MKTLRNVKVEGFRSIASANLALRDLNVVIGANGSGKSNLIGTFRLVERVLSRNLQLFVASDPDRLLHHGRKVTPTLSVDLTFEGYSYGFALEASQSSIIIQHEHLDYMGSSSFHGNKESNLEESARLIGLRIPPRLHDQFVVYHFHDTSDTSPAKQTCSIDDNRVFRSDAENLPAYLYWLQEKHPLEFSHIEEHIRLVAPFFDRFVLAPAKLNEKKIKLEWRQKGSDAYFDAYSLSDGTLRFICLATLLLQPSPPGLILLDEPELGLHPFAIRILAEMLEAVSIRVQVVIATQSVTLLNNFSPADVIVAENDGLKTTFAQLDEEKLKAWLADFSIGELWEKNVLGGRP